MLVIRCQVFVDYDRNTAVLKRLLKDFINH